jgi:hypothetical protein
MSELTTCPNCGAPMYARHGLELRCTGPERHLYYIAFDLDPDDKVCCYFCQEAGDHHTYTRGKAFLCSAMQGPQDGNANYICVFHLDPETAVQRDGRYVFPAPCGGENSSGAVRLEEVTGGNPPEATRGPA